MVVKNPLSIRQKIEIQVNATIGIVQNIKSKSYFRIRGGGAQATSMDRWRERSVSAVGEAPRKESMGGLLWPTKDDSTVAISKSNRLVTLLKVSTRLNTRIL